MKIFKKVEKKKEMTLSEFFEWHEREMKEQSEKFDKIQNDIRKKLDAINAMSN